MKAITIHQPWASLIIFGEKKFETRKWQTSHRGSLLIHSSRRFTDAMRYLCNSEPFNFLLRKHGIKYPSDLPLGAILGTITLEECVPSETVDKEQNLQELQLGDFRPGRWAWRLVNPTPTGSPIPLCGKLGMFEVPEEVLQNLAAK